ncbi:MAG: glycosyltransferase [Gammaproteobacteria bacterium]
MIYVLLPAYNEESSLEPLVSSIATALDHIDEPYRVVIVDDGSTDETEQVARRLAESFPVEVVPHGVNRGLGAAMLTGFTYLCGTAREDDLVVAMDADNTHDPKLIRSMKKAIDDGADVVIASRYAPGGEEVGLNLIRKFLSRGASFLVHAFFPVPGARDFSCGYRMYRISVLQAAFERYGENFITESSFVCMAEILVKLAALPSTIAEVGLVLRYDLKLGTSKMKYFKTILRYFRFLLREKIYGLGQSSA